MANQLNERYLSGEYIEQNPTFHVERAEFKADLVGTLIRRHRFQPNRVCDLGCGAGEVLKLLSERLPNAAEFHGYELSPQGFELCRQRESERLKFFNSSLFETHERYDLGISLDVFEHVEDPFAFLRQFRQHAERFVFHIPLDMNVQTVLRARPIMEVRRRLGHLHYFSRDTALSLLRDTGYTILEDEYTPSSIYKAERLSAKLASVPRRVSRWLLGDLGVRLTGGFSLLVFAR
jgi:SAM-dependent methyltransferase